jgi:FkbM family methyltransferase
MFEELLDKAHDAVHDEGADDGGESKLTVDADLWVRARHREADRIIVRDVYVEDCYGVDQLPWQPRYVVDVGAHLGAFACRIRRRLAQDGTIVCVDADWRNVAALERNVGEFAAIVRGACTYEPEPIVLHSTIHEGTDNTGGSSVIAAVKHGGGDSVPRATLEDLLAMHSLPWIDVLKLDCEGSELSILANSSAIDRIRLVVGEWHDRERFFDLIARRFANWRLSILREGPLGLFWLENPRWRSTPESDTNGPRPADTTNRQLR